MSPFIAERVALSFSFGLTGVPFIWMPLVVFVYEILKLDQIRVYKNNT